MCMHENADFINRLNSKTTILDCFYTNLELPSEDYKYITLTFLASASSDLWVCSFFHDEDMGKVYFPHACINENQLKWSDLNVYLKKNSLKRNFVFNPSDIKN